MDGRRFIVAGSLIDGSGAEARRNVFLAVQSGIITAIGSAADLPCPNGTAVDDFSHCTIVPALVDCSVSLARSPSVDAQVRLAAEEAGIAQKAALLERHISYCHMHGVLGVAECEDISDVLEHYQRERASGGMIDIRTPAAFSGTGDDCAAGIPAGGDYLKIHYSPDIDNEDAAPVRLTLENLRGILQHRGQRKAVVVANGRQPVEEALVAGCDAIEQGYGMGEANLREMASRGVLWIPGVLRARNALLSAGSGGSVCCRFSLRYVAPGKADPGAEAFWKKALAGQLAQLRLARKLGVKTLIGSGAGSVGILHGESMVEEMKLFIKAGYPLAEAMCCASENGVRFFGMEKLGVLKKGRAATFLITRGSVQQLPRKLAYLEGIYVDGAPNMAYSKNPVKAPQSVRH
ncbi:MAG: amidohydrolase family protein [Proteobacteria bacterium]|nr:amidohydrolase family protein [Pseudomonadota bacterium]